MLLVDTSVWIDHFRSANSRLVEALQSGVVASHAHVIGELSLGSIKDRDHVLSMLKTLPQIPVAIDAEVLSMIESRELYGRGIGYTDCHLLAATLIEGGGARLWTHDHRLRQVADSLDAGI